MADAKERSKELAMRRTVTRWMSVVGASARAGVLGTMAVMGMGALACSAAQDPSQGSGDVGTVRVALDATSAAGVTYHLAGATFLVTGTTTRVLSGDTPAVEADLAPGTYQIQLLSGFTVEQVNADGTTTPLQGTVISANPVAFGIRSQHTTPVSFTIKVGEVIVATGDGTVAVTAAIDDTLIDDFEDGDGRIAHIGGRNGAWFTFNDGTGTQTPAQGTALVPEVDPNANFILHSSGTGFALSNGTPNFGAGVQTDLFDEPTAGTPLPYNASGYTGLTFTYTFTSSSFFFPLALRFNVPTSATTPPEFGGTCTGVCFDDFGFSLFPSSFPQTVTIPFSQLAQQGFGTAATFDPTTLLSLKWNINFTSQPGDFDLTLDNVAFTR
jgi:hypothetical protein